MAVRAEESNAMASAAPAERQHFVALQHIVCWSTATNDEAAAIFGLGFMARYLQVRGCV
jgi:hypothetical protein